MFVNIIKETLMISSFVFIMMLLIEYINVQTKGSWQNSLKQSTWGQYILAAILGATPGCLGAFTIVALYSHNIVRFGALITTMIATSGDEAFVMLSLFPLKAISLFGILFVIGIFSGFIFDLLFKKKTFIIADLDHQIEVHTDDTCKCFPKGEIVNQLKEITLQRGLLMGILIVFIIGLVTENLSSAQWNWMKVTFFVSASLALFIVSTVPEHFLEKHLWEHVTKKHLSKIFLWTFGALLLIHLLTAYLDIETWIKANYLTVLIIAVLVGILPESGPHLVFVTLFFHGSLPFSILLANSIVQDGHGTLPLLAVSKRGFILLKIINIIIGFIVGLIGISIKS